MPGWRIIRTGRHARRPRCGSGALSLRKRTAFFQWPLPPNVGCTMGGYQHIWRQVSDAKHREPQRSGLREQYCAAGNPTLERHSSSARRQRAVHQCRELAINRGNKMKATQILHELGQSLWLDNITRDLLDSGTLKHYIDDLSVTGLTSNPTIFDHAIKNSAAYDSAISRKSLNNASTEEIFFELALEDLTRAADLFRPIFNETNGGDGWVSVEVSPTLAHDTTSTLAAARDLFARAARPNLLIKIPGTKEGLPAIEEAIFAGIPVNVTLLFSREQYAAAAEAFLRGIERRLDAGLNPNVGSVASVFISRWDAAVMNKTPDKLHNQLGIAIAKRTYKAARALLGSPRWTRAYNFGARPQRL